jgi:hypothetical protein
MFISRGKKCTTKKNIFSLRKRIHQKNFLLANIFPVPCQLAAHKKRIDKNGRQSTERMKNEFLIK